MPGFMLPEVSDQFLKDVKNECVILSVVPVVIKWTSVYTHFAQARPPRPRSMYQCCHCFR